MKAWRFSQSFGRRLGHWAELQLEPRDLWVGVYWRYHRFAGKITGSDHQFGSYSDRPWTLDIYVCPLPCVVLHVNLARVVRP